jgi:hypothetical protein
MKTFKRIFQTLSFSLMIAGAAEAVAAPQTRETQIIDNLIRYARSMYPADSNGGIYPMAIVGGTVRFDGPGPVYVTLRIGGQSYSALTDQRGDYSFFAYTNGAGRFEVQAWTVNAPEGGSSKIGELSLQK